MNILLLFVKMASITTGTLNNILIGLIIAAALVVVIYSFSLHKMRKHSHAVEDMILRGSDVKTSFIRHIEQVLRLSLTAINEHCSELETSQPSAEQRQALIQDIFSNGRLLNTYLNELQELTGFNGTVPVIGLIEVNLAELIASYRREIMHEVHRGVTVGIRTNMSHHCKGMLDTPMFRQLMIHLLRICAQHTKQGSITISYEWQHEGLHFLIEDTGGGLPDEFKGVVFKQVLPEGYVLPTEYRLIAVSVRICKTIVDSMHGTIACRSSEEDRGIVLDFWIPCDVRFD